jgi:hypothetical protein
VRDIAERFSTPLQALLMSMQARAAERRHG